MPTTRLLPTTLVLLGLAAFAAVLLFVSGPSDRTAGEVVADAPSASQAPSGSKSDATGQSPAQQAARSDGASSASGAGSSPAAAPTPAQGTAAPGPAGKPADAAGSGPAFDVVRIEPNGDAVIAGRGVPGATVDLLRNGVQHDRVVSDPSGLFAMTPPPLPPGQHELMLRFTAPDGSRTMAAQAVTVVIAENKTDRPMIALVAPDKPTVVLSRPDGEQGQGGPAPTSGAPAATPVAKGQPESPPQSQAQVQAAAPAVQGPAPRPNGPVRIDAIDSESGGRMFVSGRAAPGATVRLYLNDSYLASGTAGPDGTLSFSIQSGVTAGDYRVRLDEVDSVSGQVKARAEAPFSAPVAVAAAPAPPGGLAASASSRPSSAAAPAAQATAPAVEAGAGAPAQAAGTPSASPAAQAGSSPANAAGGSIVVVPEIKTTIVSRGDSLWRISRRVYGSGVRYTVIYDANDAQIRNPDLIYPGQVFVLPGQDG